MKTIKSCLKVLLAAASLAAVHTARAAESPRYNDVPCASGTLEGNGCADLADAAGLYADKQTLAEAATAVAQATFYGFGTLTNGGYTATKNGGTIRFSRDTTWDGNADGLSVLVRYSGYVQPTADAFLITLKSSAVGGGTDNGVGVFAQASDGTVHGVWTNATWTVLDKDSAKVQVCDQTMSEEGYMILTYKGKSGTILYDGAGAILYKSTALMTQNAQQVGGLVTVGSAEATMTVEGVRIFKGVLAQGEIAAAIADYEKDEPLPVSGAACLYDWTFTNKTETTGAKDIAAAAGAQNKTGMTGDSNAHYTNAVEDVYTALRAYVRPYANVQVGGGQSIAYYGTAAAKANTILFALGQKASSLFLATGPGGKGVVLARTAGGDETVAASTLETLVGVDDSNGKPHLYVLELSADKASVKVWVDGTLAATHDFGSAISLSTGVQISGMYKGKPTNWSREEEEAECTSAVSALRIYDHALSVREQTAIVAELKPRWSGEDEPKPVITKDEASKTWIVDTTKAAYTFTAAEIAELKSTAWKVTLKSASNLGATVAFGSQTSKQASHFVIESGSHAMTWFGDSANISFNTTGTAENPSILVMDGATLNFTVKDLTGWQGAAQNKTGNLVRVNAGGTLNLLQSGSNTHYYQGRYWLDPGATVTANFGESKFRLNGGAVKDSEQLYVPAADAGSEPATLTVANGLDLHHDETAGLGVFVGENSTFVIEADITSDGAHPLAKRGAGTLEVDGALTGFTGTLTANAGTLALTQPTLGGSLTMSAGTTLAVTHDGEVAHGTVVLGATSLTIADGVRLLVNGAEELYSVEGSNVVIEKAVAEVGGKKYGTLAEAVAAAGNGGTIRLLVEKTAEVDAEFARLAVTATDNGDGTYTVTFNMAEGSSLIITEIMPKPTDAQDRGTLCGMDPNGLESGWVEVENTANAWVDLKDYRFISVKRSKKTDPAGYGNFPSRLVAPGAKAVFYTSERYSNSKTLEESAFATAYAGGKVPAIYADYHNVLVWPEKVNPKKFPYVRLYYAPTNVIASVVDTVVIPSDLPEGASIVVGRAEAGKSAPRWLCLAPTCGTENPPVEGLEALGPNVGPLYEKKGQKKTDVVSEFDETVPPAVPGTDYPISLAVNGVMNPDGSLTPRTEDKIVRIRLVYRKDLDDKTLATNEVGMTATADANWGNRYATSIPADYFPAAGHLIQWKTILTDGAGNEWTSPSFHNKDDGYEWYGTIVEPSAEQTSAKLPTWHLFVDAASKAQMDTDADKQTLPYNARVAIYDASTSNYYDYVRIDLRGNTSAGFSKKSHGLRFAKAHPLTMTNVVTGEPIEEIRKTSLISEVGDPTYLRQLTAFWLFNRVGNAAPFDFPVRCNLNGEFYQLAFNSERFTDELIEDVYKFDKYGYSWKNVGTLMSDGKTTAGKIEKKTPDDEDELNVTVLEDELRKPLKDLGVDNVKGTTEAAWTGTDTTGLDNANLTKFVVEKFDLPAWINYLAAARITQEMDDVWANISIYYDNPDMLEGVRGTGTWKPLAYDMNLSFGQWHQADLGQKLGLMSTNDWFKSHPFYGGNRVRCWSNDSLTGVKNEGNRGIEAVWQSAKFRRLYLRRLRTLMDQELGAPGASEAAVPFMAEMRKLAALIAEDAVTDRAKYPAAKANIGAINVWPTFPESVDAGLQDIWDNYVVPRRQHLFVTHAATNTAWAVGYGTRLNAGIPEAQSPVAELKAKLGYALVDGGIKITNAGDETVDVSGWKLSGPVAMTIPAGTVLDARQGDADGEVYVVLDRRAYCAAHEAELTDQVIVGNAEVGKGETVSLLATDGTDVFYVPPTNQEYVRFCEIYGNTADGADGDTGEYFVLTNASPTLTVTLKGLQVYIGKKKDCDKSGATAAKMKLTLAGGEIGPGGFAKFQQSDYTKEHGWEKITNGDLFLLICDSSGADVQRGYSSNELYDQCNGGGASLIAKTFGTSIAATKDDWAPSFEVITPVVPGEAGETYETEEAATNAAAKAVVLPPNDEVTNVIDAVSYAALFKVRAVPTEGGWKLVPELTAPVSNAVQTAVDAAVDAQLVGTLAVEPTATVTTQAGLYYGMAAADALGDIGTVPIPFARWVLGNGGQRELKADKPSDAAGFYRIRVQIVPPTAE